MRFQFLIFTSLLFFISSCDRQTANNELYSRHWTEADRTLLLTELAASQELVMESITNLDEISGIGEQTPIIGQLR